MRGEEANEAIAQRAEDEAFAALDAALATPPGEVGMSGVRALLAFVIGETEGDPDLSWNGLAALKLALDALKLAV